MNQDRSTNDYAADAAFLPGGTAIWVTHSSDMLTLHDVHTGREAGAPVVIDHDGLNIELEPKVAADPARPVLATIDHGKTLRLWDEATRREIGVPMVATTQGVVTQMAFSSDGSVLATITNSGSLQLWHMALWLDPYHTLCQEAGPPEQFEWIKYAPGEPMPKVCG